MIFMVKLQRCPPFCIVLLGRYIAESFKNAYVEEFDHKIIQRNKHFHAQSHRFEAL
jgi:hypothetical protein